MEQRLTVVTVGVDDLAAMRDFYAEKFGRTLDEQNSTGYRYARAGNGSITAGSGQPALWSGSRGEMSVVQHRLQPRLVNATGCY